MAILYSTDEQFMSYTKHYKTKKMFASFHAGRYCTLRLSCAVVNAANLGNKCTIAYDNINNELILFNSNNDNINIVKDGGASWSSTSKIFIKSLLEYLI